MAETCDQGQPVPLKANCLLSHSLYLFHEVSTLEVGLGTDRVKLHPIKLRIDQVVAGWL